MQLLSLNLQVHTVSELSNIRSGQLSISERFDNAGNAKVTPASTTTQPEPIWIVPFSRNPKFVGRQRVLECLDDSLTKKDESMAVAVLHGLGGVGYAPLHPQLSFACRRLIFLAKPRWFWNISSAQGARQRPFSGFPRVAHHVLLNRTSASRWSVELEGVIVQTQM